MRVKVSALKHGVLLLDIHHAVQQLMVRRAQDEHRWLVIGPDHQGRLLELIVVEPGGDQEPYVIHAMRLRPKFYEFLPKQG